MFIKIFFAVRAFGVIGGGAALAFVSSGSLLGSLGGLGVFGPALLQQVIQEV